MKIVFQNESEIPENLKDKAVKQDDGTFIYEGDGLIKKNSELLSEVSKLKEFAKLVKGLDTANLTPEKIKAALDEQEKAGQREQEMQARIEAAVAENSRKHTGSIEAAKSEAAKMKASLERYLLDSQLTSAIAEEKGNSMFLAPVLRSRLKVVQNGDDYDVRVLNDKGEIDLDAQGKPVSVTSLVQSVKKDQKFASVFEAPKSSGSGAPVTQSTGGGGTVTPGALTANAQGVIVIPRSQAKDASVYRQALELAKGDHNKVSFEPATVAATTAQ